MPNNLSERIRECGGQAVYCTRQGETAVFGTQAALAVVGAPLRRDKPEIR
jgi:hypothetical protein